MARKDSPQQIIDSYKKRQQMLPFLIGGLAVLLVCIGAVILITSVLGTDNPLSALSGIFASSTPTSTGTFTPTPVTPTNTTTITATITATPTITTTTTPSGPYEYVVKEGDTCSKIALEHQVDLVLFMKLNGLLDPCIIQPGQKVLIPAPNQTLPTDTPIPPDTPKGQVVPYVIKPGETLAGIASRHNSTAEAIMKETNKRIPTLKWTDPNKIFAGMTIYVPVNIVTPTPTRVSTSTSAVTATSGIPGIITVTP